MHRPIKIPFSNLGPEAWKNLALTALVAFYLSQIINAWLNHALFQPAGLDYLAFWSAGHAAAVSNYAGAYDLQLLSRLQEQQLTHFGISVRDYSPVPAPLFAVFLIPFQFLSLLDSGLSFWLWSILNLVALILYLVYFVRELGGTGASQTGSVRILAFMLLSYPVFHNFFWGQIEVFLLICCGEFIRNALANKPIASGLWLGGLLAKPQVLILVLPALLLMRNWRLLGGFFASASGILGSSLALSGIHGMQAMLRLWLSYVPGIATNAPETMANWRMLGLHFGALISPIAGWTVTLLGMLASLVIWYMLWRNHPPFGSTQWVIMMGGIVSISCAFTWHSHVHLMMVIIPFLMVAAVNRAVPNSIYEIWTLAIPAVVFLIFVAAALIDLANIPQNGFGGLLLGSIGLSLNVWIALIMLRYKNVSPRIASDANVSPSAERPAASLKGL